MKILVLGAGSLGGFFGGWLAEQGADVTFLVRPARKAVLDAHGLIIESPIAPLRRPVRTVSNENARRDADIVLLACKAYDLDNAIAAITPAMSETTAVLPILNGLAHIDRLVEVFGANRVIGGLCKIQATLGPDGHIMHMNDWNEIVFGELDGLASERVRGLEAMFPKPQVNARAVTNIREELWKKLVHLSTVAAVTTLTRQALGGVNATRDGPWLVQSTLEAAARVAAAEGYPMAAPYLSSCRAMFASAGSAYKASMLRDMEKGNRAEGEHILGFMRDRAAHHGLDAPIFRIAAANVQAYEQARIVGP